MIEPSGEARYLANVLFDHFSAFRMAGFDHEQSFQLVCILTSNHLAFEGFEE